MGESMSEGTIAVILKHAGAAAPVPSPRCVHAFALVRTHPTDAALRCVRACHATQATR
jgi:hypothetical protein